MVKGGYLASHSLRMRWPKAFKARNNTGLYLRFSAVIFQLVLVVFNATIHRLEIKEEYSHAGRANLPQY